MEENPSRPTCDRVTTGWRGLPVGPERDSNHFPFRDRTFGYAPRDRYSD